MDSTLSELKTIALQLNEEEKLELVQSLVDSLDSDKTVLYENEWMNIAEERAFNYKAEKFGSTSWNDIKKELGK